MTTLAETNIIRHNHLTRDIKPLGAGCPACDAYHLRHQVVTDIEDLD